MQLFNQLIATTLPLVPRPLVRKLSSRYIAGENAKQALALVRKLNAGGMSATLDILGEFVAGAADAELAAREYVALLRAIRDEDVDSNVSIKLTQLGLALDKDVTLRLMGEVLDEARTLDNLVRIDMEDSPVTQDTLDIHAALHAQYARVGCVIQAYLRRSRSDVAALAKPEYSVRLCKGIYIEPEEIVFKDPLEINRSYDELLRMLLEGGASVGIATHDERLVDSALDMIREIKPDPARYEFQMLLGVTETLRSRILAQGHRLRVYVPYGSHWYAYSIRRLKENPQIAGYALKGIFGPS